MLNISPQLVIKMISVIIFIISGILAITSACSIYPQRSRYLNNAALLLALLSGVLFIIQRPAVHLNIFVGFWIGTLLFMIALGIVIFKNNKQN